MSNQAGSGGRNATKNPEHDRQLLSAATLGDADWVELALHFGANVAACDDDGNTAMHLAMMHPSETTEAILLLLLEKGGNSETLNKNGKSALDVAYDADRWDLAVIMSSFKI